MKQIYLDNAATTPMDSEVIRVMTEYLKDNRFGNPSSIYTIGRETKESVERARNSVAMLIGAKPEEIVFTSGGTESNNFALKGIAYANRGKGNHIITTQIEHHSVLESAKFLEDQGFIATYIEPDKYGFIDPAKIKKAITKKTILISVMHANNEIGTIEPIEEIGKIAREYEIYFHTDCVQTVGHIPLSVDNLFADLLSLSAHKFYGPKGVGVLYIRKGTKISSFIQGGGQEKRMRAGTENTIGIIGLGKAAEIAKRSLKEEIEKLTSSRDMLINGLLERLAGLRLNGHPDNRLPNNVNISIPHIEGEALILHLDKLGIYASTGSACSSTDLGPSHVLMAIGLTKQMAHSSVRFTLGRENTEEDIGCVLDAVGKIVKKLLKEDEK